MIFFAMTTTLFTLFTIMWILYIHRKRTFLGQCKGKALEYHPMVQRKESPKNKGTHEHLGLAFISVSANVLNILVAILWCHPLGARAKNSVHPPHCALVCLICTYLHMQCENPIQNQGGRFFFVCAEKISLNKCHGWSRQNLLFQMYNLITVFVKPDSKTNSRI